MKDVDKLVLGLGLSAALVSASLVWLGVTLREALSPTLTEGRQVVPAAETQASPAPLVSGPRQIPVANPDSATRLTQQEFDRVWREHMNTAEERCWKPRDVAGEVNTAAAHMTLRVATDGSVVDIAPHNADFAERFGDLFSCLGEVVKSMKLPSSTTERKGMVQVSRPTLFGEPPTARPSADPTSRAKRHEPAE